MVRRTHLMMAVALAAVGTMCGGGGSSGSGSPGGGNGGGNGGGTGGTCRTYPTAATVTTVSSGVTINAQLTGAFDSSTKESTVMSQFSSGSPCTATVTSYDSVADFVDEVRVIPGVTLATGNVTTNSGACGTGSASVTFSYDAQRRLTQFTSIGGTTAYTAWDSSGRPTTGTANAISISNVYDDAARTLTQTQVAANGAQTVTTITFDANGNQTLIVVNQANTVTTTTFDNTSTAKVCK